MIGSSPPVRPRPSPWAAVLVGLVCFAGALSYWQALRVHELAAVSAPAARPIASPPGHAFSTIALAGGSLIALLVGLGLYAIQYGRRLNQFLREEIEDREEAQDRLRRSEGQFRQVVEHISEVFWLKTPDHKRFLYVSPAYETIWGRACHNLLRNPEVWLETVHPEDRGRLRTDGALTDPVGFEREYRILRPDGAERWIRERAYPVRQARGGITAIAGTAQDITAYKEAALAVQRDQRLVGSILDSASEAIYVKDLEGRYVLINKAGARFLNKTVEQVLGHTDAALFPASFAADLMAIDRRVLQERRTITGDEEEPRPDGKRIFATTKSPYLDPDGRVIGLIGISREVTEQRLAEARLRQSEAQLYQLFFQAPVGLTIVDDRKRLLKVNQAFCDLVGCREEDIIGNTFAAYIHPDDLEPSLAPADSFFRGERTEYALETRYLRKNGEVIWVAVTAKGIRLPSHSALLLLATVENITARKQAEAVVQSLNRELEGLVEARTSELAQTQSLAQQVIDSSPDWIFVKDRQHKFLLVNQAFAVAQGRKPEDMIGRPDTDFWSLELCEGNPDKQIRGFHTDDREAFEGRQVHNPHDPASLADGTIRIFDTIKSPLRKADGPIYGVLCYCRDVTEQRQAQEALQQGKRDLERHVAQRTAELALANHALQRDIAARRQAEQALTQSEARYRSLFEDNPSMYFSLATDGTIRAVNRFGAHHLGYTVEELIGQPVVNVFHPDDRTTVAARLQASLLGDAEPPQWEFRKIRKDGTVIWVQEIVRLVRGPNQEQIFLVACNDVTLRKRMEEALRVSAQFIRELHEITAAPSRSFDEQVTAILDLGRRRFSLPVGLLTRATDDRLEVLFARAEQVEIPGGTNVPLNNAPCLTSLGQEDPVEVRDMGQSAYQAHPLYTQLRLASYLGTRVMLRASPYGTLCFAGREPLAFPFTDADKSFLQLMARWVSTALEQSQADRALRLSEQRTRAIIDTSMDAVVVMDGAGTIREWSPQAVQTFGWTREEALGRRLSETIVPPAFRQAHELGLRQFFETGSRPVLNRRIEIAALHRDGREFPVELTIAPLTLPEGVIFSAYVRDITERKQAEEALSERARLSQCVGDIGLLLNNDRPIHELLQGCTDRLVQHLGLAFARVWTLEPGDLCGTCFKKSLCADHRECLHLQASSGLSTNLHGEYRRIPLGTLKIGRIAQGTDMLATNDIVNDDRLPNKVWMKEHGLQSFAGLPLVIESKVYGVLAVFGTTVLSEPLLRALETICNGTAATIARKHAQDETRKRWAQEQLVAALSSRLVACTPAELERAIDEVLTMIGELLDVDRSYLFLYSQDRALMSNTHEWCAPGIPSRRGQLQQVPVAAYPWIHETCRRGEVANISRIAARPPEAEPERSEFQREGIQALLGVPLMASGSLIGFIGLDAIRRERIWTDEEVRLLRLVGEMLGRAIERDRIAGERTSLLRELQSANSALGQLSHQLMQVQETERQHLAQDLHDEIGQALTAATINLHTLSQRLEPVGQPPELKDSLGIVEGLIQHVRDLCLDLRPSMLDDLGLVPALRWYATRQATRAGWTLDLDVDEAIPALPESVQVACFRIAQEAITNAMRHAGAQRLSVRVRCLEETLVLSITDDGVGFPLQTAGRHSGLGLLGMQERARAAGGDWSIESTPGHGTTVRARLPINGLVTTKAGQFSEALS